MCPGTNSSKDPGDTRVTRRPTLQRSLPAVWALRAKVNERSRYLVLELLRQREVLVLLDDERSLDLMSRDRQVALRRRSGLLVLLE